MKVFIFIIISIFTLAAAASAKKMHSIEAQVANNLNGLFEDTLNEGEGRASVNKVDGKYLVKCSSPRETQGGKVIFCSAEILVIPSQDSDYSETVSCTGLSFVLSSKTKIGKRYSEDAFRACLENAGSITEF